MTFNEIEPNGVGAKGCESRAMIGAKKGPRTDAECENAVKSADMRSTGRDAAEIS
jgi:hypothetical protein